MRCASVCRPGLVYVDTLDEGEFNGIDCREITADAITGGPIQLIRLH